MPRYTELPARHRGEEEVARQLDGMQDPACHLWFNIEALPSVREIDVLLLHEQAGLFVIEVKAVPLAEIVEFGLDVCEIRTRGRDKSPQLQAYDAATDLRNYLKVRLQLPFVVATACWPRITRRRWKEVMRDPRISGEFAERMIFQEDLTAGATVFRERLRYIYKSPPVRKAPSYGFQFDAGVLQALRTELRVEARPQPVPSDLARLRAIEGEITSEALRQAPADAHRQLLYTGHPGTGKTFRLLQIGYRHALAGRRVLLVCFNKVLATDLRRLMSFSSELRLLRGSLEIRDVFEMIVSLAAGLQLEWTNDEHHDEWSELVLSELQVRTRGELYDTILVDEGQDLRDWAFAMVEWLAKPEATMAVAVGRGQELYGTPALWLESFRGRAREHRLRRNFRNTRPVFQLAHVMYEGWTNLGRIDRAVGMFRRSLEVEQLEFMREQGDLPRICYLDDSEVTRLQPSDPAYAHVQHETMAREYQRVLRAELEALRDDEWPVDLLVLVPSARSLEREWAAEAIRQLREDYAFLDYTEDNRRRVPARPTDLRLCTYHSARGIEGSRVVVFGLEHLGRVAESSSSSPEKLAYITLSRSIAECIIAVPRSRTRHEVVVAIERALAQLRGEAVKSIPTAPPERSLPAEARWIPVTNQSLKYGDVVRHEKWGRGHIVAQLPADGSTRLVIDFEGDAGTQTLFVPPSCVELKLT